MVNLSDLKPLFYAARFFGCGPHLVTSDDILLTKTGLFYSFIWALGFVCCWIYGLHLICLEMRTGWQNERNIVALVIGRTLLAYVCFFADGLLTIVWNSRLRAALLNLRNFDAAVSYETAHRTSCRIRWSCRAVVATVLAFWVAVGYVTYKCELTNPLFNAITYVIANAAISMQLIKFAGVLLLLRQRFGYLRELLQSNGSIEEPATIVPTSCGHRGRELQMQDVWWLHCSLGNAADTVNEVYSTQLLLWIATMWINALSRIYAMNETLAGTDQVLLKLREGMLVTACIGNLIIITGVCHFTSFEANSIGKAVFMPQSTLLRKRSLFECSVEVGTYFKLRELYFSTAGGLIRIDLPLLLSIAGAMTTYLVVLHNSS